MACPLESGNMDQNLRLFCPSDPSTFEKKPHPSDTVDGRNPAPPKKPWKDDSLVNTNKRYGFNHSFQVVRNGFRPSDMSQESCHLLRCLLGIVTSRPSADEALKFEWFLQAAAPWRPMFLFHLVTNMFYFPLLVLKGIYHYWKYVYFFQGT